MSYNNSRNAKNNYPTMSQSEWDNAPWNDSRNQEQGFEVNVAITMSRDVIICTDNYRVGDDNEPNTDNTDWRKEYENKCYAIPDLLKIYLKKDIESNKGNKSKEHRLNELLEACQGWNVEELEVEEL